MIFRTPRHRTDAESEDPEKLRMSLLEVLGFGFKGV